MDNFTLAAAVFYAIICIHTAGAARLIRRVGELESDMIILKIQHKDTVKSIGKNAKFISQLNETVSALEKCTVPDHNRSSGFKEIRKGVHDESGRNLNFFRAFKEEKNQRRIYENQIHKALDEHKKEMKTAALDDKTHIEKTMNNFSAILNELKVDINFSFSEINKSTTDDIESLKNYVDNLESIVYEINVNTSLDVQSNFAGLIAQQNASHESLKIQHTNDIESLKRYTDQVTVSKAGLESIINEIQQNRSRDIKSTFDDLQNKLDKLQNSLTLKHKEDMDTFKQSIETKHKQDISSIEIKHKQDMDSFKKSIEIKHEQVIESLTAEHTDLKAIVNEISHNIAPYVDQWKRCRDGGTRRGDFLYKYFNDAVFYAGAREACAVCGGHVADIQEVEENTFVHGLVGKHLFWLGATDTATEGTWIWERTGEEAKYTNWEPGEPDNYRHSNGVTEQCLYSVWGRYDEKWCDISCDSTLPYVCKYYLA